MPASQSLSDLLSNTDLTEAEVDLWVDVIGTAFRYLVGAYKRVHSSTTGHLDVSHGPKGAGRSTRPTYPTEPEITTDIYHAIKEVHDALPFGHPDRRVEPHCEDPVKSIRRRGTRSRRRDLSFHVGQRRLVFEAKRIIANSDIRSYIGADGIGCFTTSDSPYTEDSVGAMVGYVFAKDVNHWIGVFHQVGFTALGTAIADVAPSVAAYFTWESKEEARGDILMLHHFLDFC